MRTYRKPQIGFTLIESVVSLLLLAFMSMMAYQAVEVVLSANQRSRSDLADEIRLHRAWQIIANDLIHLRPKAFSDGQGRIEPAFATSINEALVSFTRGHDALLETNPTGITRINYQLNTESQLLRSSQPAFLSPRIYESKPQILLSDVAEISFEQLTEERVFVSQWPPLNSNQSIVILPRMVKVTILLNNGSSTSRLFPGVENGS